MKKLCSEPDCFKEVEKNDLVLMSSGDFHPISTKCWDCREEGDGRKLRKYKQRRRRSEREKLSNPIKNI